MPFRSAEAIRLPENYARPSADTFSISPSFLKSTEYHGNDWRDSFRRHRHTLRPGSHMDAQHLRRSSISAGE